MAHSRIWRFRPPAGGEAAFAAAYAPDGRWAELFATSPGFRSTRLLRPAESGGNWLTIDCWDSAAAFDAFQSARGDAYRALDAELEGLAGEEFFVGAFDDPGAASAGNRPLDQSRSGAPSGKKWR